MSHVPTPHLVPCDECYRGKVDTENPYVQATCPVCGGGCYREENSIEFVTRLLHGRPATAVTKAIMLAAYVIREWDNAGGETDHELRERLEKRIRNEGTLEAEKAGGTERP